MFHESERERFIAIDNRIGTLVAQITIPSPITNANKEIALRNFNLAEQLRQLRLFARLQFFFFYDGFRSDGSVNDVNSTLFQLVEANPEELVFKKTGEINGVRRAFECATTGAKGVNDSDAQVALKNLSDVWSFLFKRSDPSTNKSIFPVIDFLEKSAEFPPAYTLQSTLDRIARDLVAFENAWYQSNTSDKAQMNTIKVADSLARSVFKYVSKLELRDGKNELLSSSPLSYFERSSEIRVIPYSNIALIRLPNTAYLHNLKTISGDKVKISSVTDNVLDLLAIPHEIGHYIFWNARDKNGERLSARLKRKVAGRPAWVRRWIEEIFADVFSALVGGKYAAESMIKVLSRFPSRAYLEDNEEHPLVSIRPYIYFKVLRDQVSKKDVESLKGEWESELSTLNITDSTQFFAKGTFGEAPVNITSIGDGKSILDEVVTQVLDTLRVWDSKKESILPNTRTSEFQTNNASLFEQTGSDWNLIASENVIQSAAQFWFEIIRNRVPLQSSLFDRSASKLTRLKLPGEVWRVVLSADGWNTGGQPDSPSFPNYP